jgi:hypothetical protein
VGDDSGRNISDCIIVDNNIYCFQKHITNGILVPQFKGEESDDLLIKLKNYLIEKFIK